MVDQTIVGLAQGRKIEARVVFLGGPLYFLKGLRERFVETLKLEEGNAISQKKAPILLLWALLYMLEFG